MYLDDCVKSLVNQTYTNIEIILVDDGSKDNCPDICDAWEKKDNRIKAIHKKNGGLGDARNAGIVTAKGEYITFIDSDDWVSTDYIQILMSPIEKYGADISINKLARSYKRPKEISYTSTKKSNWLVCTSETALRELLYQRKFDTSAPGKIFRSDYFKDCLFPKTLFEDLATTYKILEKANKIAICISNSIKTYFYYKNPVSITQSRFTRNRLQIINIMDEEYSFICDRHPALLKACISRKFSVYCYIYRQIPDDSEFRETQNKIWNYIETYRKTILLDRNTRVKNKAAAALSYLGKKNFKRI